MTRCHWCTPDPLYIDYHDHEWGVPQHNPCALFELLMLEGYQAGLSWLTVLKKRAHYRQVLHGFDPARLAGLSNEDIHQLLQDPGVIRHKGKLQATRNNARVWLQLEDPATFLWSFVEDAPRINRFHSTAEIPAQTPESRAMSQALQKAGMRFVGPTICYAFMQASGMVIDHTLDCFKHPLCTTAGDEG